MEEFFNNEFTAENLDELLDVMAFAHENEEFFDAIVDMSRVSAGSVLCTLIEANAKRRGEDPVEFAQMLIETIALGVALQ